MWISGGYPTESNCLRSGRRAGGWRSRRCGGRRSALPPPRCPTMLPALPPLRGAGPPPKPTGPSPPTATATASSTSFFTLAVVDLPQHLGQDPCSEKLKTRVVRNNVNPMWNEDLTLCVVDPTLPIKLVVYDKDTFGSDDPMGHAELDIEPFVEVVKMHLEGVPNNTIIKKVTPNRNNCLADESKIYICDGKVFQDIVLRLKDVECGEVELQLQWVDVPSSRSI